MFLLNTLTILFVKVLIDKYLISLNYFNIKNNDITKL